MSRKNHQRAYNLWDSVASCQLPAMTIVSNIFSYFFSRQSWLPGPQSESELWTYDSIEFSSLHINFGMAFLIGGNSAAACMKCEVLQCMFFFLPTNVQWMNCAQLVRDIGNRFYCKKVQLSWREHFQLTLYHLLSIQRRKMGEKKKHKITRSGIEIECQRELRFLYAATKTENSICGHKSNGCVLFAFHSSFFLNWKRILNARFYR